MKRWKLLSDGGRAERNRIAFQGGSYSLIATAVVLAILIALNILVSALPANLTKYDMSASKLYSITSNTKVVVNALEEDVTIYWIVQSGKEDDVIETLLNKYDSLSDHITVVKKNPDVYPTFAEQYTSETVQNNSLVVECGERSRFIGYDDIYVQEPDLYSYTYNTSFDGEGAVTSAIDYVVTEDLPQLYVVEGHGEQALPGNFQDQIGKENIEINTLSSGSNSDLAMNALSSLIGESEAMAIRSKSLNYNYLSISDSTASLLKTLMIGVFPLGYLGIGVCVIGKRRREQHEAG